MLTLFEISFMCAVCGYVYADVLLKPGEVLGFIHVWLVEHLTYTEIEDGKEITHESWFYKPLGGCGKCVSGQIAFWSFIIFSLSHGYNIAYHAFVVCLSILMYLIINKIMIRL